MIDEKTAPYGALLLRVCLASMFAIALYRKFAVQGIDAWWNGLLSLGYPSWVLGYSLTAEFLAVLMIFGVMTRWLSLFVLPMMIGATHFWMQRKGYSFAEAGYQMPLVWSIMLVIQALLGDGAFAVKTPAWLQQKIGLLEHALGKR